MSHSRRARHFVPLLGGSISIASKRFGEQRSHKRRGRTQGVLTDGVDGVHIIATGDYSPALLAEEPVIIAKGCNGKDMSIVHCLNALKTGAATRFLCLQDRAGSWNTLERGYDFTYQGRPGRPAALHRS